MSKIFYVYTITSFYFYFDSILNDNANKSNHHSICISEVFRAIYLYRDISIRLSMISTQNLSFYT